MPGASLHELRGALVIAKEREAVAEEKLARAEAKTAAAEARATKRHESGTEERLETVAAAGAAVSTNGVTDASVTTDLEKARLLRGPMPGCARKGTGRARSWIMVIMGHSGSTAIVSGLS